MPPLSKILQEGVSFQQAHAREALLISGLYLQGGRMWENFQKRISPEKAFDLPCRYKNL
jgi:hypothetical protein